MENRIAVLSLSGALPIYGLATATDNSLHIFKVMTPAKGIEQLKQFLDSQSKSLSKNNVTLFVDDPSGLLNDYGYKVELAGKDEVTGEQVLNKSMSRYLTLNNSGAITLPENAHGFDIPQSVYNIRFRDDGSQYYNVDWPKLNERAILLLLFIHCAYSQNALQTSYTQQMFSALDDIEDEDENDPLDRMIKAINGGRDDY